MRSKKNVILCLAILSLLFFNRPTGILAQSVSRDVNASAETKLEVENNHGRVYLTTEQERQKATIRAESFGKPITESNLNITSSEGKIKVTTDNAGTSDRIDLYLYVPERTEAYVVTKSGAVDIVGKFREATVETDTGTIRADVPTESLKYTFVWTASRPRYFSDIELAKVSEKSGGKYEIEGQVGNKKADKKERIRLNLLTQRGVILFGVASNMVPADLKERELTTAAKAIIKSGDNLLIESISKVSPKLFRDYVRTLPDHKGNAPALIAQSRRINNVRLNSSRMFRFNAHVTDRNGRAIAGLTAEDFNIFEQGEKCKVTEVLPASAPFNLVLLLDLSGSVEERFDFIRKAALSFVDAASPQDRVAITAFREDVQVVSDFTSDHKLLKERISQMDAGGPTAFYDALTYTLVHTLKPLRNERTAIIILSDGDDNKSFVPFPALLETVTESGTLIYPLYIPSGLVPRDNSSETTADPTRTRYLTLTTRAKEEAQQLASISGGIYYPIAKLEDVKMAFNDVIKQLRASYTISYESKRMGDLKNRNLRVSVARDGVSIHLSSIIGIDKQN